MCSKHTSSFVDDVWYESRELVSADDLSENFKTLQDYFNISVNDSNNYYIECKIYLVNKIVNMLFDAGNLFNRQVSESQTLEPTIKETKTRPFTKKKESAINFKPNNGSPSFINKFKPFFASKSQRFDPQIYTENNPSQTDQLAMSLLRLQLDVANLNDKMTDYKIRLVNLETKAKEEEAFKKQQQQMLLEANNNTEASHYRSTISTLFRGLFIWCTWPVLLAFMVKRHIFSTQSQPPNLKSS